MKRRSWKSFRCMTVAETRDGEVAHAALTETGNDKWTAVVVVVPICPTQDPAAVLASASSHTTIVQDASLTEAKRQTHRWLNAWRVEPKVERTEKCGHPRFRLDFGCCHLTEFDGGPVTDSLAELKICCADCGERFHWLAKAGVHPAEPRVSIDGAILRAPIVPASRGSSPLDRALQALPEH